MHRGLIKGELCIILTYRNSLIGAREYEFLALNRWGAGKVSCPRCQTDKVTQPKVKGYYYCQRCAETRNLGLFNAATGTAFARYKLPLKAFLYAAVILNKGKYGLSTLELSKKLNVTLMTSNKICKRLVN